MLRITAFPTAPRVVAAILIPAALLVALVFGSVAWASSHTAKLASLELSGVTLKPDFDPDETDYEATVSHSVATTTVEATAADSAAKVQIQSFDAVTGSASRDVPLSDESLNTITVKVTKAGTATTYTIEVTRIAKTNAGLAGLKLSGVTLGSLADATNDAGMTVYGSAADPIAVAYDLDSDTPGIQAMTTVTATPVLGARVATILPDDADTTMPGHQVKLDAKSGTTDADVQTISIRVVAADGKAFADHSVTLRRASGMRLSSLKLTHGDDEEVRLNPTFDMETVKYTASVPYSLTQVTVAAKAEAKETGASLVIAPTDADADTADTHEVDLNPRKNKITVTVGPSGSTRTYTVTVTRARARLKTLRSLSLDGIALEPGFSPNINKYEATVPDAVDRATVRAAAADSKAKVKIGGAGAVGGQATLVVELSKALADQPNTITVQVTDADGTVRTTYTIEVTRIAKTNAGLAGLKLSGVTLGSLADATNDAGMTVYGSAADPIAVAYDLDSDTPGIQAMTTVTATPVLGARVATILPDDADTTMPGHQVKLDAKSGTTDADVQTISIRVVAADGKAFADHSVTLRRASGMRLSSLKLTHGDDEEVRLNPTFDMETVKYTASVPYSLTQVTVAAKAEAKETGASLVIAPTDADADTADTHEVDLNPRKNKITVTVGPSGSTRTYTVTVTRAVSADATLKKLEVTVGGSKLRFYPDFEAGHTKYTASAKATTTSGETGYVVTATPTASDAKVWFNDATEPTEATGQVKLPGTGTTDLSAGLTTITIHVKAPDGTTTKYEVKITGVGTAVGLESLRVNGEKAKLDSGSATMYRADVDREVAQVTVKPMHAAAAGFTQSYSIIPVDADPDMKGHQVDVDVGETTIRIDVTATHATEDTETAAYTLTVTRAASTDAMLSTLSLSGLTLDPAFDSGTTIYSAEAAHDVDSTTVMAMAMHEAAMVDGTGAMDLAEGANTITVTVTAEDGSKMAYTIVVTRAAPPVLDAVPAFSPATASVDLAAGGGDVSHQVPMATGGDGNLVYASDAADPLSFDAATRIVSGTVTASATVVVTATDEDGDQATYTLVISVPQVETVTEEVEVEVPGPTVVHTRTVTKTETVEVEVPAPPNVIGGTMQAMATEVDGRVLITRHDGGPSLVVDIGGFIRDESLGQTYQVVRRMDGMVVRQWVSPNSPLVYQIPWSIVNTQFTVPVGVIMAIPLDDQSGSEGQLVRRFDGSGDDRIFSYAGMGQWRHVPDPATLQALGFYWCDVTAADSEFFNRISVGPPHPATMQPESMDYPSCSTG